MGGPVDRWVGKVHVSSGSGSSRVIGTITIWLGAMLGGSRSPLSSPWVITTAPIIAGSVGVSAGLCDSLLSEDTLAPQLAVRVDFVQAAVMCKADARGLLGMAGRFQTWRPQNLVST